MRWEAPTRRVSIVGMGIFWVSGWEEVKDDVR